MKRKILVVDDSGDNLYMLETLLKGCGYDVTTAEHGEQALEKARSNPPDLIVSDSLMPVMDGYNLCREWKADDTLRHRPFVLYTATHTDSGDEKFAMDLGVDRFIPKPQEPDVLVGMIGELLEDGYRARQVEAKSLEEEMQFFRQYNEILFQKLEQKLADLETANRDLKLSEESYRRTFLNASDVIYTVDGDLILRSISPSVERILGYKAKDFVDRPVTEFGRLVLTPESFERAIADVAAILGGRRIASTMYEFIARDGTLIYGEVSGSPLNQDGKVIGIVSVARDITDRMLTETALRENEEKYRSLFDHCPDAVYALDAEGGFLSVNDSTCRITGYSREELLRMKFDPLIVPDEKKRIRSHFQKALYGEPQNYETTILRRDGGQVIIQVTNTPVTVEGKIVGVYAIAEDITERVRAERALRENEEKYRSMFDHSMDAILLTRPDGTILDANPAACTMFGRPREEIVRIGRNGLVDTEDPRLHAALKNRAAEGATMAEFTMIRANGEKFPVEMTSSIFTDEKGQQKANIIIRDITERKQAEEALKERDARYKKLFSEVPGMIYQFLRRPDGTYCMPYSTEFIRDIFGCLPQDVREDFSPFEKVILPDDLKEVIRSIESSAEQMSIWQCEFRVQIPGQPIRWILGHSTPERLADGGTLWHGFITDITERRRHEEALQKSEADFQDLFNEAPVGYFEYDVRGHINRANHTFSEMLGYQREEMIGQPAWEFIQDERARQQILNKLAGTVAPFKGVERLYRRKDGSLLPVLVQDRLFRDEQGRIMGIRCTAQDITERRKVEEALESEHRLLQSLINNIPDRIYVKNTESRFILCNEALIRRMGRTRMDEILGRTDFDFLTREVAQRFYEDEQEILRSGKPMINREEPLMTEDGKVTRWSLATKVPLLDREGNRIGIVGVGREITDLKQAQENLHAAREHLLQAEKLASLGRLSAGVAHEILNPVNIISLELQLLTAKGNLPLDVLEELKICMAQIERIVRITKDLKQLSRFPSGKTVMADINGTIAHIMNVYATQLKIEKIEAKMQFQPDLPMISMDKEKIEQVILNLITNAADAMEGIEKKVLRIRTERERTGGSDFLKITIADNGKGISNENLAKIYDPFFTTKEPGKGTGLGLSISYGIIQDHGGMIWAANNEWGGASFYFRLPVKTDIIENTIERGGCRYGENPDRR